MDGTIGKHARQPRMNSERSMPSSESDRKYILTSLQVRPLHSSSQTMRIERRGLLTHTKQVLIQTMTENSQI